MRQEYSLCRSRVCSPTRRRESCRAQARCMRCMGPLRVRSARRGRACTRPRPASSGARGTARMHRPRRMSSQTRRACMPRCPQQQRTPHRRAWLPRCRPGRSCRLGTERRHCRCLARMCRPRRLGSWSERAGCLRSSCRWRWCSPSLGRRLAETLRLQREQPQGDQARS